MEYESEYEYEPGSGKVADFSLLFKDHQKPGYKRVSRFKKVWEMS